MTRNLLPDKITIGEKYDPAMAITDEQEAREYFELCVEHTMRSGKSRVEAEEIERKNLGYYAGYYDSETRAWVERLYNCAHLFLGAIAEKGSPTAEEAYEIGWKLGRELALETGGQK